MFMFRKPRVDSDALEQLERRVAVLEARLAPPDLEPGAHRLEAALESLGRAVRKAAANAEATAG